MEAAPGAMEQTRLSCMAAPSSVWGTRASHPTHRVPLRPFVVPSSTRWLWARTEEIPPTTTPRLQRPFKPIQGKSSQLKPLKFFTTLQPDPLCPQPDRLESRSIVPNRAEREATRSVPARVATEVASNRASIFFRKRSGKRPTKTVERPFAQVTRPGPGRWQGRALPWRWRPWRRERCSSVRKSRRGGRRR